MKPVYVAFPIGSLSFLWARVGDDIREVTVKSQSLGNTPRISTSGTVCGQPLAALNGEQNRAQKPSLHKRQRHTLLNLPKQTENYTTKMLEMHINNLRL